MTPGHQLVNMLNMVWINLPGYKNLIHCSPVNRAYHQDDETDFVGADYTVLARGVMTVPEPPGSVFRISGSYLILNGTSKSGALLKTDRFHLSCTLKADRERREHDTHI